MNEKITIKIPCEDNWGGSDSTDLGKAIGNIKWGKVIGDLTAIDVPTEILHKWTAQLRSIQTAFEDAVAKYDRENMCADRGEGSHYKNDLTDGDNEFVKRLKELGERWQEDLKSRNYPDSDNFNMDGIYPHYASQPKKILFVGREACYLAGQDYMTMVYDALRENSFHGWTINQYPFHRRQFYIAYGILRALKKQGAASAWSDLPWASDMAAGNKDEGKERIFATSGEDGISWAFMNLSKISNESGDYRTDSARYNPFVADEDNRAFIRQEIRILNPDIIIGANVNELADILGYDVANCDTKNKCCYYYPPMVSKASYGWQLPPFLNCYHFAAIKSDEKCFYNPVMAVLSKHISELGWLKEDQAKKWRDRFLGA